MAVAATGITALTAVRILLSNRIPVNLYVVKQLEPVVRACQDEIVRAAGITALQYAVPPRAAGP